MVERTDQAATIWQLPYLLTSRSGRLPPEVFKARRRHTRMAPSVASIRLGVLDSDLCMEDEAAAF
jgi:hypothetical protein